jgi:hypothetical protein
LIEFFIWGAFYDNNSAFTLAANCFAFALRIDAADPAYRICPKPVTPRRMQDEVRSRAPAHTEDAPHWSGDIGCRRK